MKFALLFLGLFGIVGPAAAAGPALAYEQVGTRRFVARTAYYNVMISSEVSAADAPALNDHGGEARSKYRAADNIDWAAVDRAVDILRTQIEPRLEKQFARLDSPSAWKSFFPIDVVIDVGVSPLYAGANEAVHIGDDFSPAQSYGWAQIVTHETGHILARKIGMKNSFYDEFWADFFAVSIFDHDPRMMVGFAQTARAKLSEYLAAGGTQKVFAELQLAHIGQGAARNLEGEFDLQRIYRFPNNYVISVELNRMLHRLGARSDAHRVSTAGLNIFLKHGRTLDTDVFAFAHLWDEAVDPRLIEDVLREGRVSSPQAVLLSLRKSLRTEMTKDRALVFVKPSSEYLRHVGDHGLMISVLSGDQTVLALNALEGGTSILDIRRGEDCRSDEAGEILDPRLPLSLSVFSIDTTGVLRKEVIPLDLRQSLGRKLPRGLCWKASENFPEDFEP